MSFPRYPSYKDSGVEWLGEVPEHWVVMALKWDLEFLTSGSRGWAAHYADNGALFLRIGNLTRIATSLDLSDIQRVEVPDGSEGERTRVRPGDVLFSITAYLGSVAVVPDDLETAYVSQHIALARPAGRRLLPAWIGYVTLSAIGQTYLAIQGYGGTKIQLSLDDVAGLLMTVPPLAEQYVIVDFLDRETAKIDALVAEYRALVDLLKEKRQAVISQAVTKGLDPTVPMKDSGVEWLGEVPEHWAVKPLKHLAIFRSGGTPSKDNLDYWDGDVPWASAKDLKSEVLWDTIDHITEDAVTCGGADLVPPGSVLVVVRGMILARTFPVAVTAVPMAINQDLKALECRDGLDHLFLARLLQASADESSRRIDEAGHGTKALRMEAWTSINMPVPPIEEQSLISGYIDQHTTALDTLTGEAEQGIALLQERRTALISATVTGKIDVRGLVSN